jgi:hypothetical protein
MTLLLTTSMRDDARVLKATGGLVAVFINVSAFGEINAGFDLRVVARLIDNENFCRRWLLVLLGG